MGIDTIKYVIYSRGEHSIILYDRFDKTFAIHSKDEENDVAIITGFDTAALAIEFANTRIIELEKDSRSSICSIDD